MNKKKLSAEKRQARQAMMERFAALHAPESPRLRLTPSAEHVGELIEIMKKLAVEKGLLPLTDEEAKCEAQRFVDYMELGLNIMKEAADKGTLSAEETAAIRRLEPVLK